MNPLPEGFRLMLVVNKLKTISRLDYKLVTPSHPEGILLTGHAGVILSSLMVEYGRSVARSHFFEQFWGDDEDGGPLDWEKVIDVQICKARRVLRLAGVDFDYGGDYGRSGRRALTLTNLRECVPYGEPMKKYLKPWKERKARSAAAIARQAERYSIDHSHEPMAQRSGDGRPVDYKLMKAKQAFKEHNRPLPDLWAKPAHVEVWEARKGERS